MANQTKNTLLVFGGLFAILCIPIACFSFDLNAVADQLNKQGTPIPLPSQGKLVVTGLTGNFVFPYAKFWFILFLFLTSNILVLMHNSDHFSMPRLLAYLLPLVVFFYFLVGVLHLVFSKKAGIEFGAVLMFFSGLIPIISVAKPKIDKQSAGLTAKNE